MNAFPAHGEALELVAASPMSLASRKFVFEYHVKIPPHDSELDIWIPAPRTDAYQKVLSTSTSSPVLLCLRQDIVHNNHILYAQVPPSPDDQDIVLRHTIERSVRRSVSVPAHAAGESGDSTDLAKFLAPDARVPIEGPVVDEVVRSIQRNATPRERARDIFDHLLRTLVYDPRGCTPERVHELGDLSLACDLHRGTCTEFHGLYVARARALDIPARFAFGFNVPTKPSGQIAGYHCWSEVYLPGTGWFAVDASEAWKRDEPAERSFYFGNLDANRVQFTTGRDIILAPPQRTGAVDTFIFPLAESGGRRVDVGLTFQFKDLEQRGEES
jgi:transglutaminase-like putative cysteine protease